MIVVVDEDDGPDLEPRPPRHREVEPHARVAIAVLEQAIADARAGARGAAAWLVSPHNVDRDFWCAVGGINRDALRDAARRWDGRGTRPAR